MKKATLILMFSLVFLGFLQPFSQPGAEIGGTTTPPKGGGPTLHIMYCAF